MLQILFCFCYNSIRASIIWDMIKAVLVCIIISHANAQGSSNLLINTNFMQPMVPVNVNWLNVNSAPGWDCPFQLFNGNFYNSAWPTNRQISQMSDPSFQSLVQVFNNTYDYYTLFFQYSLPTFITTSTLYGQTSNIFWNGNLVQQLSVYDQQIHNITIQLTSNTTTNQLKIVSLAIHSTFDGIGFTNFVMTGYYNVNITQPQIEEKHSEDPIQNCLRVEQMSGNCVQCQSLFVPQGNTCKCQNGFYFSQGICKACLFPCENCQDSPRKCINCSQFYSLQGNQCVITDVATSTAAVITSFPGFDFLSVGQMFIANLDQFWPYYSHHRQYGEQTDAILTFIHTIQNNKWVFLGLDKKIDFNYQSLNFSPYGQYSNQKFLEKESRTSYFWDGAFELVIFCFPISLIIFFILRALFFLTFNYKISRHFRQYSFFFMIYFLGFEADLSFLSFLSFQNAINFFSFKLQDKIGHIIYVFIFYMLALYCVGGFFIAKILYKRLSKYFIDDFCFKIQSFYILSCLSMRAFAIGAANAFLATSYVQLIISLGSIETAILLGFVYFQWNSKCYKMKSFVYFQMLKSITMIIFNVFLWFDWKFRTLDEAQADQSTKNLLDFNCKVLIIIFFGLGALQIILTYFPQQKKANISSLDKNQQNIQKRKRETKYQNMNKQKNKTGQGIVNQKGVREKWDQANINKYTDSKQIKFQVKQGFEHSDKLIKKAQNYHSHKKKGKKLCIIQENHDPENLEIIYLKRLRNRY